MDLSAILRFAVTNGASDIHLQAGAQPMLRIQGNMRLLGLPGIEEAEARRTIAELLASVGAPEMDGQLINGIDFSYSVAGIGRFRCSAFSQLNRAGLVMRVISSAPPPLASLNLPAVIEDIALEERGLVLVTGTTGSGKSTTLAAMIDLINSVRASKIITIEDPVEFVYENKKSLISQMEVGQDTPSFAQGLRQGLRQDPDVIVIGELRDLETLRIALQAADTGHQVFATVHSSNAWQTVERIIAMFPPAEHRLLLSQLAKSIEAIVSQRLVTSREGPRWPAIEILRGTPVTEKFILENKLPELSDYIAGGEAGMQSFDQHLLSLYNEKRITGTQALRWSTNAEAMSLAMRGIRRVGGGVKS
ncbi:MAG: PilT/PilU family type 4a pilus ATPase [Planctomycetes bacterium]|nr:PilT/PilU family type 4a pilus ATPase [Planctomycetota bacterium]